MDAHLKSKDNNDNFCKRLFAMSNNFSLKKETINSDSKWSSPFSAHSNLGFIRVRGLVCFKLAWNRETTYRCFLFEFELNELNKVWFVFAHFLEHILKKKN
jgi:hypothetical protein